MRILVVIPHDTLLGPQGARRRLDGLFELLYGHELSFFVPDSTPLADGGSLPGPLSFFSEPSIAGRTIPYLLDFSRGWLNALEETVRRVIPEIVIFNFPWGLAAAAKRIKSPLVYFSHGVERDFAPITLRHLGLDVAPVRFALETFIGFLERAACREAALVIGMSDSDGRRYRELYGCERFYALPQPIGIPPQPDRRSLRAKLGLPAEKRIVVFHGSYSHLPNREAIENLKRHVAPRVLAEVPESTFLIAGKGVPVFEESGIRSAGFVEDLSEFLSACDLAVVPVVSGCGVRMKLFDYFAAGVPCVSTRKGAEGLFVTDEKELILVGEDMNGVAAAVIRVLRDDILRRSLRESAKEYLRANHDPGKLARDLANELETQLESGTSDFFIAGKAPRVP